MDQYNTKKTLSRICQPNNENNLSCKKWWSDYTVDDIPDTYDKQKVVETLKSDVNNFLFDKVSPKMTIGEFDVLSFAIFKLIISANQEY